MIKITVLSDTHGNRQFIDDLDTVLAESDYIIHLGDTSGDGGYISKKYPDKVCVINGNCDVFRLGADEKVLSFEGVKILACHGHKYSVKQTLAKLAERAKKLGCGIALYGHTHLADETELNGVTLLNPGTGSRYAQKSYLYLMINGEKAVYKTVFVD